MGKIKQFIESEQGKDILTVLIVILVGLGSFELGRLSKADDSSGIQIEYLGDSAKSLEGNIIKSLDSGKAEASSLQTSGKNYFASNRGTKYYTLGCSGGKTIKQENRIYFSTSEEAEDAGYSLSASCN